jgi:flagellar biosynthetic protein FliP
MVGGRWSILSRPLLPTAYCLLPAACCLLLACGPAAAAGIPVPQVSVGVGEAKKPEDVAITLQLLALLTVLAVAPAVLMMMTSFTRIVIVLSLTRSALGTQHVPPNQVLMGLSLCLTFFTMQPTLAEINARALQPYMARRLPFEAAVKAAQPPIRRFMLVQTSEEDLALFVEISRTPRPRTQRDVPTFVIVPAFIISELKTAFTMGFIIYLPFLVIDMVVSLVLMSMGMVMLPPALVSLPFKLLLFVMVDGWHLLSRALALSFQ